MKRLVIAFGLTGLIALGLVAACKQGEGERCQVDDDCEDPLVCAQATQTCADNNTSAGLDAMPPTDAPDAMPDAFVQLDATAN